MLIRIVKMSFREEAINDFLTEFYRVRSEIESFKGCSGLELLRDINNRELFFTYSRWKDENALESYRNSILFNNTWAIVKKLFNDKPQAWSVEVVEAQINP